MSTTITMPSLGESVAEGEIGKWLVQEGDRVEKDQPLVEIMTDKADSEIPAPEGGVVTQIYAAEGAIVAVGDRLCEIDPAAEISTSRNIATAAVARASEDPPAPTSPAVRKLARERDVELGAVSGTGDGGRITKDDVLRAAEEPRIESRNTREAVRPPQAPMPKTPNTSTRTTTAGAAATGPNGAFRLPPYVPSEGDERVPFSRRRRIIADHMVYSKLTSPHVVTFAECDLNRTAKIRELHKATFKKAGLNLTFLAFVAEATCRALREYRELNSRVLDDAYVKLREINLGIAVDTEQGLVVPVIQNADELSIRGLARSIDELAVKARDGALLPDDLAGKTFTISNPGRKGNLVGGAIISQPNVGILRMGEIKKRVVVVEHEGEDLMAIHKVMHMALSYDHRVVDGVHANGFLWRIVEILESGDVEV